MQSGIIEVPLNKLVVSEANVRKTNRTEGVEELAANIAGNGGRLIQSLAVRPLRNEAGEPTGVYRVPAGGRRLAALKLLAKRKVIAKTAPVTERIVVGREDVEINFLQALPPPDRVFECASVRLGRTRHRSRAHSSPSLCAKGGET